MSLFGKCHLLAMFACSKHRPRWHTSPRLKADVTVSPLLGCDVPLCVNLFKVFLHATCLFLFSVTRCLLQETDSAVFLFTVSHGGVLLDSVCARCVCEICSARLTLMRLVCFGASRSPQKDGLFSEEMWWYDNKVESIRRQHNMFSFWLVLFSS